MRVRMLGSDDGYRDGAPWEAPDVDLGPPPVGPSPAESSPAGPPPSASSPDDISRDLVAALARERTLYADDAAVKALAGELLAAGHTVHATAKALGLRPSTVWGWMADPQLRAAMRQGVEYLRAKVAERLLGGAVRAGEALTDIAADPAQEARDRIAAATELLDRTGFGTTATDVPRIDVSFVHRLERVAVEPDGSRDDGSDPAIE